MGAPTETSGRNMEYHSLKYAIITLTPYKNLAREQCLAGSLTGEVDSYSATELHKGWLTTDGNRSDSVNA